MTGIPYTAPLRCEDCGARIDKKPKAKVPKYCPPCRHKRQEPFRTTGGQGKPRRKIR